MRMTCPLLLEDQKLDSIIPTARLLCHIFHQDILGHKEHFPYLGIDWVNLTSAAATLLSLLKIALTLCMMTQMKWKYDASNIYTRNHTDLKLLCEIETRSPLLSKILTCSSECIKCRNGHSRPMRKELIKEELKKF